MPVAGRALLVWKDWMTCGLGKASWRGNGKPGYCEVKDFKMSAVYTLGYFRILGYPSCRFQPQFFLFWNSVILHATQLSADPVASWLTIFVACGDLLPRLPTGSDAMAGYFGIFTENLWGIWPLHFSSFLAVSWDKVQGSTRWWAMK